MHVNPVVRDSGIGSMHHEYQVQLGTNTPMLQLQKISLVPLGPTPALCCPPRPYSPMDFSRSTTLTLVCVF